MIRDVNLLKMLVARIESGEVRLPMSEQTAMYVIKAIVPAILDIMKTEIAEAKREWTAKERQQ